MALDCAQVHAADAIEQFHQLFVPFGNGSAQLIAVHIKIIEQPGKALLGRTAFGGIFNMAKDCFQRFVQVLILGRSGSDVAEQLRWQHEKAFFLYQPLPCLLCLCVREPGVVKTVVPGGNLPGVDVLRQIFGDVPIEHRTKHIALEVPAIHAAPQFVGNGPDRPVEFFTLLLFSDISHKTASSYVNNSASFRNMSDTWDCSINWAFFQSVWWNFDKVRATGSMIIISRFSFWA